MNEVKPNVYREYICKSVLPICHILVDPDLVGAIMLAGWASLRSAPTYKNHATAPE
ncbi:hypothetical protein [Aeromonas dhakensis]|uniref:hypothetical protein n=1 Tax=Aeromonas dhakensis TaxID=196024 RepID=UPI0015F34AB3|nr:hypothetical protein [Aeromonas dhakensis]MBQ4680438.1 hypothetical protein [Aeromonas dhakensis]